MLHVFIFCMHMCLCMCVCVCSSPAQCVSCSTAGNVRPPALPARCACAQVFVYVRLCVCERNRQDSPMGSMLSLRKADYGTCQGVRNTPHQHYTDSQLSTHLYGCNCKAPSLLLPPTIWRRGQVLPPQLETKLDSCCPYISQPGLPMFVVFLSAWEPDELARSKAEIVLTKIKIGLFWAKWIVKLKSYFMILAW